LPARSAARKSPQRAYPRQRGAPEVRNQQGSPALRRPSAKRAKSSDRSNGVRFFELDSRKPGSYSSARVVARCAASIRLANAGRRCAYAQNEIWIPLTAKAKTEQPNHSGSLGDSITASTRTRFSIHGATRRARASNRHLKYLGDRPYNPGWPTLAAAALEARTG
jgi:hypothetical protein